jgi:hypothetical protein
LLSFPRFGEHYKNHASWRTDTPFFPPLSDAQMRNLRELDLSALTNEQFPPFESLALLTNVRSLSTDFEFQGTNLVSKYYWIPPLRRLAFFGQFDLAFAATLLREPNFPLKIVYDQVRSLEIEERDTYLIHVEDFDKPRDITFLNVFLSTFRNIREFKFGPCSTYSGLSLPTYLRSFFSSSVHRVFLEYH